MRKSLLAILSLAVAGIAIAAFLLWSYYSPTGICSSFCDTVLESSYAVLFGIPIGLIGLAGFAILLALATYGFVTNDIKIIKPLFVLSTISLLFVGYLVYLELAKLHAICNLCTAAHFLGLTIWGLLLFELSKNTKSAEDGI